MKGFLRFFPVLVFIGIFASNAWANKPKILQLKDLKPGTHAIGFSVFKGVEPQPFDVVLGEPVDYMGNSLILSRVSGGPMDTLLEEIGAIAGMSGSPVFIGDCKDLEECRTKAPLDGNDVFLVGSTSYGPGYFIKGGPNFLLTPAEYMLGARFDGYVAAGHFSNGLPNKISIGGRDFYNLMLFPKIENLRSEWGPSPGQTAPFTVGRRSPKHGDEETLPIAVNSNNHCKEPVKSDIKPGSMVTVFLATGVVNIGASGTVTWRDGNKIYVFGHPLMGSGMVSYPFVQVSVADTLQTPLDASKLIGCYLDTKGAMLVDGAFEVAGAIGATASMLPYHVELHMGNGGGTMSEEVAASPLAPAIIKQLPVIWAQQLLGDISHLSLAYQMRITIENQPEIFVRNFIPAQVSKNPLTDVFNNVYRPIQVLKESRFSYGIESVKVRIGVVKDFQLWTVKKSFLSQEKAVPGETVYVNIVLEEYFSSVTKQISIPIKVPDNFIERTGLGAQSTINVLVQSGSKFTDKREPAEITSVEDLIKQVNQSMNYRTNVLYVQQIMPKSNAEEEANEANAKVSVKLQWKWTDIGESDLKQLPSNEKKDVVLTLSPALDDFIELDLSLNLMVQSKEVAAKDKKEDKKRKRFLFF